MNETSIFLSPIVEQAIEFAARWHANTFRKSAWRTTVVKGDEQVTVPTISHVSMVAMIIARCGFDDKTVAAAYLHDVVEDANGNGAHINIDELAAIFDGEVAAIVDTVSEIKRTASGKMLGWKSRKTAYVRSIRDGSISAKAVSLADKIHNLWTINQGLANSTPIFQGSESVKRLSAGPVEQLWFFEAVLEATDDQDERVQKLRRELASEIEKFKKHTQLN